MAGYVWIDEQCLLLSYVLIYQTIVIEYTSVQLSYIYKDNVRTPLSV